VRAEARPQARSAAVTPSATNTTANTADLIPTTDGARLSRPLDLPQTNAGINPADTHFTGEGRDAVRAEARPQARSAAVTPSATNTTANTADLIPTTDGTRLSRPLDLPQTSAGSILPTAPKPSAVESSLLGKKSAEMTVKERESLRGTPAATSVIDVKSWFQRDEFAASMPQPSEAEAASGATSRPKRERQNANSSTVNAPGVTSLPADRTADPAAPANSPDMPTVSPADHVAKVTTLLQEQVVHFRQTAREAVEVVLRPDSQTELHVQLVQRAGQIEATVRCDRGDTQALGGGWSRLQESLAQQGVRLAPLGETSMGFAGEHSRQGFNSPRQPQPEAAVFAPVRRSRTTAPLQAITPTAGPAQRAIAAGISRRSLDSWA